MSNVASNASPTALLSVVAALALVSPGAAAEPISPLAHGLLGVPVPEEPEGAQRFQTPDGALRFTLDRSASGAALMRIDGRDEVLALKRAPGPRGDELLKNDIGRVVVKVSAMGGVTVYAASNDNGAPAMMVGTASRVAMPAAPAGGLTARMSVVERETARAVGHAVSFEPPAGTSLTSSARVGLVADAAERAAEGLVAVRSRAVRRVVIQFGAPPEARLEQDALRVTVTPNLGYAGRPSAEAIKVALTASSR